MELPKVEAPEGSMFREKELRMQWWLIEITVDSRYNNTRYKNTCFIRKTMNSGSRPTINRAKHLSLQEYTSYKNAIGGPGRIPTPRVHRTRTATVKSFKSRQIPRLLLSPPVCVLHSMRRNMPQRHINPIPGCGILWFKPLPGQTS